MSHLKKHTVLILSGLIFAIFLSSPEAAAPSSFVPGELIWHTFQGGIYNERANAIALDANGNIYITGKSTSEWIASIAPIHQHSNSPITSYHGSHNDVFVAKLDSEGALVWYTFLGDKGKVDEGHDIALDSSGNVYVAGALDSSRQGFVAKLSNNGAFAWMVTMGSSAHGIAVDNGNLYVTGDSWTSWGLPINPHNGGWEVFVAKLNSSHGQILWNTFMGTTNFDYGRDIAIDQNGDIYVTGQSTFPYTDGTWRLTHPASPVNPGSGNSDAFVTKLHGSGIQEGHVDWYTFMGTTLLDNYWHDHDIGYGVAVDRSGSVYVTGHSGYSQLGWNVGFLPIDPAAGSDCFVAGLDSGTGILGWYTFMGGNMLDNGFDITLDLNGNIYVTGSHKTYSLGDGALISMLDPFGNRQWLTYLNESPQYYGGNDGRGIAVDDQGFVFISGAAANSFGTPRNLYAGAVDVFVAKLFNGQQLDTTPPVITIPADITVNNDPGQSTANVTFEVTATDDVDEDVPVVCDPESGTDFPIGTTTVNCTATDAAGNEATGSFTVIVEDNEPPVITVPEDITAYTGAENCSAHVEFTVTATDNSETDVTIECVPASGSTFEKGLTTVTCTATDESGNSSTAQFNVSVIDDAAPVIACPEDITVGPDPGSNTAVVNFAATATDNCDNDVAISYSMPPGSAFPIGKTTVLCTAADDDGNQSICEFTITVEDAKDVEPPVITVANDFIIMWPPNHKYRTFTLQDFGVSVTDNSSANLTAVITKVSSDEPENAKGKGDGNTTNDMVIGDNGNSVSLRAERQGKGNGRIYTVYFEAVDQAGNTAQAFCKVGVPHEKKDTPVDDGPVYWVTKT